MRTDLLQVLDLLLHYLSPLYSHVGSLLNQYFTDDVKKWRSIRETLLIFFELLLVFCYFFLFKRAINGLEKKKQLTRSMLLIIPSKAIAQAESLRKAIADLVLH